MITRDGTSGGGIEASLIAMLLVLSVPMLAIDQSSDEVSGAPTGEYTGTGTIDDPFSGTVVFGSVSDPNPFGYYFTIGTTIDFESREPSPSVADWSIDEGFGLSVDGSGIVTGTITNSGTIKVTKTDFFTGGQTIFEIYAVEPTTELVFESDPTSGDIVYVGN